jgi:anti-anti-sigma factor
VSSKRHQIFTVYGIELSLPLNTNGYAAMEIIISEFDDANRRVTLIGKLDIAGAGKIELALATVAGSRKNVVIDMVGVDFIASIGIRHLVMAARTVSRANGKFLLFNPTPLVTEVLVTAGLEQMLPIVRSEDEVLAALRG